jgi:hypothetical protein
MVAAGAIRYFVFQVYAWVLPVLSRCTVIGAAVVVVIGRFSVFLVVERSLAIKLLRFRQAFEGVEEVIVPVVSANGHHGTGHAPPPGAAFNEITRQDPSYEIHQHYKHYKGRTLLTR